MWTCYLYEDKGVPYMLEWSEEKHPVPVPAADGPVTGRPVPTWAGPQKEDHLSNSNHSLSLLLENMHHKQSFPGC